MEHLGQVNNYYVFLVIRIRRGVCWTVRNLFAKPRVEWPCDLLQRIQRAGEQVRIHIGQCYPYIARLDWIVWVAGTGVC